MQLHLTLFLSVSLAAGTAFGQANASAQPDTMQALLMEVRQLRQTLVVIQRLGVQQQHVDALSWRLDQVRDQIARSAPESNALIAAVAANEARLAKEQQAGAVRHDIEDEIRKGKAAMEEKALLDGERHAKERQLAGELQAEQAKLHELKDWLDRLERASSR